MQTSPITLVIRQPSDERARQLLYQELLGLVSRYGGVVTSIALEDVTSLCELLEQKLTPEEVAQARLAVVAAHARNRRQTRQIPADLKA